MAEPTYEELLAENQKLSEQLAEVMEQVKYLTRKQFGRSKEDLSDG